jgi:ABC-type phosphate/phosphonate transport system substrate-binding protein
MFNRGYCEVAMVNKSNSGSGSTSNPSSSVESNSTSRRDVVVGATLLGAVATVAAPAVMAQSPLKQKVTLSYYPWITQSISGDALRRPINDFRDLLQADLRKAMGGATEVELLPEMEIPDQLNQLKAAPAGEAAKIGLLNPLGYALVRNEVPAVEGVAVIRRQIGEGKPGPIYKAQLYTHRKVFLKKEKELEVKHVRGHSLAYGTPQSTSNFLVPAMMLMKEKIHPFAGLPRVEFTGGHDKAAAAVYEGRLEVGAGHDGVIFDLATKAGYRDAKEVLVWIAWSEEIPSDPVAVHASDPAIRDQVRQALLRVARPNDEKSAGNQAIRQFWGTTHGFEAIAPEAAIKPDGYKHLLGYMAQLNLTPDDVLRK